jgi:hypothetical protein
LHNLATLTETETPSAHELLRTPLAQLDEEAFGTYVVQDEAGSSKVERVFMEHNEVFILKAPDEKREERRTKARDGIRKLVTRYNKATMPAQRATLKSEISDRITKKLMEAMTESVQSRARSALEERYQIQIPQAVFDDPLMVTRIMQLQPLAQGGKNAPFARELLTNYLSGNVAEYHNAERYPHNRSENVAWLNKRLSAVQQAQWLSPLQKHYAVEGYTDSRQSRIDGHIAVIQSHLSNVPSSYRKIFPQPPAPSAIVSWYESISRQYRNETWHEDLSIQVEGIKRALNEDAASVFIPKRVSFKKEMNPMRVLDMGTLVGGSCLDSLAGNAWSTVTNALEVNKSILWITDEKGGLLGRVLIALDERKRFVRFRVYYARQTIDLNPYVDTYLKEIGAEMKLKTRSGSVSQVKQLFCNDWYKDPQVTIQHDDSVFVQARKRVVGR